MGEITEHPRLCRGIEIHRTSTCLRQLHLVSRCPDRAAGSCGVGGAGAEGVRSLGEGRFQPETNKFQVEGTATTLRQDLLCGRRWPTPRTHITFDPQNNIGKYYSHFTSEVR